MTRLLLAEDEPDLAQALARGLRDEAYIVDVARDGGEALWAAGSGQHDALVLDVRMPVLDGNEVCRRLRAAGSRLPVLMLTACDDTRDVVKGLDAGADDYLTKPFVFAELLARLRALLRRGSAGTGAELVVAHLRLDTTARRCFAGEQEVPLTAMEYRLLEMLLRNVGRVQSRERLASALWDDELGPGSNSLEVHMRNLRRKLEVPPFSQVLHTRRGVGYVAISPNP